MFTLLRRLRARLKYRHFDRDLSAELEVHRAMKQDELEATGLTPDEATARNHRALGNVTYMREETRNVWLGGIGRFTDQLRADLRDGARSLRRSPAFTLVAICVLALGIGLNTAIFSVAKAVFLPDSPVPDGKSLVYIGSNRAIVLRDFRAGTEAAFVDFSTHGPAQDVVVAGGRAAQRQGEEVSANYFEVINIRPALGRTFHSSEDDLTNGDRAVVVSHGFWTDVLGSDPNVLASRIRIGTHDFTVIGVTAPGFAGLSAPWRPTEYWVTRAQASRDAPPDVRRVISDLGSVLVARLRPGVSIRQARDIATIHATAVAGGARPQDFRILSPRSAPIAFEDAEVGRIIRAIAWIVMGIGFVVLLIACTNIAGVMSARGVSRRREFAVRQALGAGGWRLIQQRLLEGILLAFGGGSAGLVVAWFCVRLYRAYSPAEFVFAAPLDAKVLAYTSLVCLAAGILIGLAPALRAQRSDLLRLLGGGAGAGLPRRERRRLQYGVLVPQMLLSVVLLIVGGVYGATLLRMEMPAAGYRTDGIVASMYRYVDTASHAEGASEGYSERRRRFDTNLLGKLGSAPGVAGAALSSRHPSQHSSAIFTRWVAMDAEAGAAGLPAEGNRVSAGFFSTFGIPLLRGRDFDARDTIGAPAVAIVSESFAKAMWPGADPIGRSFGRMNADGSRGGSDWAQARQVIGVVADTRSPLQTTASRLSFYSALWQTDIPDGVIVYAVAAGATPDLASLTRAAIEGDRSGQALTMQTGDEMIAREMYPFRAAAWLLGVAGVASIALAALGLYGVVAHSVAQQTREFGIRATLGATRRDITRLVLVGGARVALIGGVTGVIGASLALVAASHWAQMAPVIDPLTITAILCFIFIVVLTACYIPARRAASVDPALTLRAE